MTQQGRYLKIFERIVRSNLYLFVFSRYMVNKFFSNYIYESEFKILKILEKNFYFKNSKQPIIDVGANDGISYKSIRNFLKKKLIISFEPLVGKFSELKNLKKNDKNYKIYKCGLSNKNSKNINLHVPYYKRYELTPFSGINKNSVISRLQESLFVKDLLNKITFKIESIKIKKLDNYNLKPDLIKIDVEGHEYECVLGSLKTIKKNKPILIIEYNKKINIKILKILKKFKYNAYFYNENNDTINKYDGRKVFNIIYISDDKKIYIN